MKGKNWILGLFVIACIAQAAVPLAMVLREERTLANGEVFRLRCAPVDPYDPFRGRYVALSFDIESAAIESAGFARDDVAFATLATDDDGFARLTALVRERPAGVASVKVRVRRVQDDDVWVDLPFDRYFLNEEMAPEAERAYREAVRERNVDAWAEVRVRANDATLVGLYIDDVALERYVRSLTAR